MVVGGSVSFCSKRDRSMVCEGFHSGHSSDTCSNHVGPSLRLESGTARRLCWSIIP